MSLVQACWLLGLEEQLAGLLWLMVVESPWLLVAVGPMMRPVRWAQVCQARWMQHCSAVEGEVPLWWPGARLQTQQ